MARPGRNRWERFRLRIVVVGATLLALLALMTGVAVEVYALPPLDHPDHADAVLVLGPPTVQRLLTAQRLVDDGVVDRMYVSVPPDVEEDYAHPRVRNLCAGLTDYPVTCFTPGPFTTQGEARAAESILTDEGLDSIVVVTSVTHIARARVLFDRCLTAPGHRALFVSDDRDYDLARWVNEFLYQTGAFVKVLTSQPC